MSDRKHRQNGTIYTSVITISETDGLEPITATLSAEKTLIRNIFPINGDIAITLENSDQCQLGDKIYFAIKINGKNKFGKIKLDGKYFYHTTSSGTKDTDGIDINGIEKWIAEFTFDGTMFVNMQAGFATTINSISDNNVGQSVLVMGLIDGVDNWQFFAFDYSTDEFNIYDSGISSNFDFYVQIVQNLGYSIKFWNGDTVNYLFLSSDGKLVQSVLIDPCHGVHFEDHGSPDGRVSYLQYYNNTNRILKVFNGAEVHTFIYNLNDNLDIWSDWDYVTSDNSFTMEVDHGDGSIDLQIIKSNGEYTTFYSLPAGSSMDFDMFVGNFSSFVHLVVYDNDNSKYTNYIIYNTDGEIIHNIDVSNLNVVDFDSYIYGHNKSTIIFADESNVYSTYSFDGKNLTTLYHNDSNTTGYIAVYRYVDSDDVDDVCSEAFAFIFFDNLGEGGLLPIVNYCSISYLLNGDQEYTTFTFTIGSAEQILPWSDPVYDNAIVIPINLDDGNLYVLVIDVNGVNTYLLDDNTHITNVDFAYAGASFIAIVTYDDSTNNVYLFKKTVVEIGLTEMIISDVITVSNDIDWEYSFDTFVLWDYDNDMTYISNASSPLFIPVDGSSTFPSYAFYARPNNVNNGILTVSDDTQFTIITRSGVSKPIAIPYNSEVDTYYINVGRNTISLVYTDIDNSLTHIAIYDLDGRIINLVDSSTPYIGSVSQVGDRVMAVLSDGEIDTIYLVSPTAFQIVSGDDFQTISVTFNDFAWWNE